MSSVVNSMKVNRQDLNESTVLLEIVCGPDQVQAGFAKALKQLGKNVKIPGFRPGTAPAAMLEKAIPEYEVMNAAAENIVNQAYKAALEQEKLEPVDYPVIDLTKLEKTTSECEFTAKVPLPAKVELGDYTKLKAEKIEITVSDEEVEQQVTELRKRDGKHQKVTDRGIHEGDMAVVNIKLKDEEGDGRSFMVVAGQTFPELDKVIAGMEAEEIKQAELNFPETFQEKDWAGQKKSCTVTIRSITAMQLPELDDEFAKGFNIDNVADLKDRVREGIRDAKDRMQQDSINEQLLDQILQSSQIVVSDTTWESVARRRLADMEQELKERKVTIEQYAEQSGMSMEELQKAIETESKLHVHRALIIENIFKTEKMEISDDQANHHFIEIARENGVQPEGLQQFAKQYGDQIRSEVIYRAMYSQVMDFLNEKTFGKTA